MERPDSTTARPAVRHSGDRGIIIEAPLQQSSIAPNATWYRKVGGFALYAFLSYLLAVVMFVVLGLFPDVIETAALAFGSGILDGVFALLKGTVIFIMAIPFFVLFGVFIAFPIPIIGLVVGYPVWLSLVPRFERLGWSRSKVVAGASSAVAVATSMSILLIVVLCFDDWDLDMLHFLGWISGAGLIASNVVGRLFYLNAT